MEQGFGFEVAKTEMQELPRKVEVIEEVKTFLGARVEKNEIVLAKFARHLQTVPERGLPWTARG